MFEQMQPIVLAAIEGPPSDGAAIDLELNLKQVSDAGAFDWASVTGRRVVILPGKTNTLVKLADVLAKVAVAARASSVGRAKLPSGLPVDWHAAMPVTPAQAAKVREAVRASECRVNPAGLPDRGLLDAAREPVPEFPVDEVFPPSVAAAVRMCAAAAGAPVGYVATSLMVAALGATSASVEVEVRPGWVEPGILWAQIVGDPSANKSPSQRCIELPLESLDRKRAADAAAVAALTGQPANPVVGRVSDCTIPAAYLTLAQQQRGIMLHSHEGGAFMAAVAGNWKQSTDRGAANALYDGRGLFWHRRTVSKAAMYIPRCAASILLLIQPEALAPALGAEAVSDGFIERFLFDWSAPDPHAPQPSPEGLELGESVIARIIERCAELGDLNHMPDGLTTTKMRFSAAAAAEFIAWRDRVFEEDAKPTGRVSSALGKGPGHAARIAAALQLIAWAVGDAPSPPEIVPVTLVKGACALREGYYEVHRKKTVSDAAMPAPEKLAAAAARWIVTERPKAIDPLYFRTRAKIQGVRSREEMLQALGELEARNWLAPGVRVPHHRDFRAELPPQIPLHPRLYEFV